MEKMVERRSEAQAAIKASEFVMSEIDAVLLNHMRTNDLFTDEVGEFEISIGVSPGIRIAL